MSDSRTPIPEPSRDMEPSSIADDEISLLDLLLVLAENARLLVVGPLLVGALALGYAFLITPTFVAQTRILPPQQQQGPMGMAASQFGAVSGLAIAAGLNLKNPADLYVALILSRTVADRIIDRFDLMRLYETKFRQDARWVLAGVTGVASGKDGLITVEVEDRDPKRAADMANAYVEELARLNATFALTDAQRRRAFFEKQLQKTQERLKSAELAMHEAGIPESVLKSYPANVVAGIATLKAQITTLEIRLSTMRSYLTEQNPEYQLAQRELSSLRAQLAQATKDEPASRGQHAQYIDRYREYKYQETVLDMVTHQYEAARLDEAREGALIQVVDVAVPPEQKSKPNKVQIAVLAALATGMLLVLFVFARHALRNARNDSESAGKLARIASALGRLVPRRS